MEEKTQKDDSSIEIVPGAKQPACDLKDTNTSIVGGMFNVANAALGAGLLTFPKSFATTGLALGISLQVVLASSVFVCLTIVGSAAHLTSSTSYSMICRRLLGRPVEIFSSCLLILYTWTSTIAYLQVIVKQLAVFGEIYGGDNPPLYLQEWFTTCIFSTVVVFLPFIWMKNMRLVAFASAAAIAFCWYLVIFVFVSALTYEKTCSGEEEKCAKEFLAQTPYPWRLIGTLPAMCFGYQCHLSSVNNFASLSTKAKASYAYVALGGALVCFLTYTSVGVAGYVLFDVCAGSKSLVLNNYSNGDIPANIGRVAVTFAVAFSFPLLGFAGRNEVLRLFDVCVVRYHWEISESNIFIGTVNRRIFWISLLWFGSNLILACLPGDGIDSAISFIGTTAGFWMFIFPGIFAYKLADLMHEDTIREALEALPGAPHEELYESWTNGIRTRITRWLTSRERVVMKGVGLSFFVVGVLFTILGYISFFYGAFKKTKTLEEVCP